MSKLSQLQRKMMAHLRRQWEPPLSSDPLPVLEPAQARAAVVSFYMVNVSHRVVLAQRRVLKLFTPPDVAILQIETSAQHGTAMQDFIRQTRYRTILFLDIDCIPLHRRAIGELIELAEGGALAGAIQRTNHFDTGGHLFVAPSCMALTPKLYREIGEPSLLETPRGDTGEELTYIMEQHGRQAHFLWPTSVDGEPIWALTDTISFGRGTTFGGSFWHAFEIRDRIHQERFIRRCEEVLAQDSRGHFAKAGQSQEAT